MPTVHEIVTERMIKALEAGTVPWQKPWQGVRARYMTNGKPAQGINIFLLATAAAEHGYTSPWWGSWKAIESRGVRPRTGEKSEIIVFWKIFDKETDETDERGRKVTRRIPVLRYFRVWNADQCDGLPEKYYAKPGQPSDSPESHPEAAATLAAYVGKDSGPSLHHGGNQAFYTPGTDSITLPAKSTFAGEAEYFSTAFHEATHSTGHHDRLARKGVVEGATFGCEKYAREELVAEMGSAILCAIHEIDSTFDNSAAYVAAWLKALRDDSRLVVTAAAQADKAAKLIMGTDEESDTEESEVD